jgi:hypothetical protein
VEKGFRREKCPAPGAKWTPGLYLAKGQPETSRPVNKCLSITLEALWPEVVDFRLEKANIEIRRRK